MKTNKITIHLKEDPDGNFEGFDEEAFEAENRKHSKPGKAKTRFRPELVEAEAYAKDQLRNPEKRMYFADLAKRRKLKNAFEAAVDEYKHG